MATPPLIDLDAMLAPISEAGPSGEDLRYLGPHDELREARRAEDEGSQGDWERQTKVADWDRVIDLGSACLAGRSKDLQIAAWIAEALTRRSGFAGLRDGLDLVRSILGGFWDTCFPEVEDGDLEMRAGPLIFLARVLPPAIRSIPLTHARGERGCSFFDWKKSRDVANELRKNPEFLETMPETDLQHLVTIEKYDKQVALTARAFAETQVEDIGGALEAWKALGAAVDAHFGRDAPGLSDLRKALEDCLKPATAILAAKPATGPEADDDPDEEDVDGPDGGEDGEADDPDDSTDIEEQVAPSRRRRRGGAKPRASGGPIVDADDARARIIEASEYLRGDQPGSAAAYLVVRALRLAELYDLPRPIEPTQLAPPDTEIRQSLRRLEGEERWEEALAEAERALGRPEGRGWLDPHRVADAAMAQSSEVDRSGAADAARALLRSVLLDFPEWPDLELDDGTPAASSATRSWLRERVAAQTPDEPPAPAPIAYEPAEERDPTPDADVEPAEPDARDVAAELVRDGRAAEAVQVLRGAISRAPNGRGQFLRKLQLAELCVGIGRHRVALPLADELSRQVDEYQLGRWEDESLIARIFAATCRCLKATEPAGSERLRVAFDRLCRIDIGLAMEIGDDA